MKLSDLANKKILIVGMGIEGKATLEFLRHHFPKSTIDAVDKTDGEGYLSGQEKYDIAVKSPSIKKDLLHIPYTTATNIFFANTKGMVIGVTGTKGKSTTATLIYEILKTAGKRAYLVGNIGAPALSQLLGEKNAGDIYVYELSSYQLEDIEYSPHIAVVVSFFPEHMDHHGSVDAYWTAKKRIAAFLKPEDYLVFNPGFGELTALAKETKAQVVSYIEKLPFEDSHVPLLGRHNRDNVRAAVTVAGILKIPPENVQQAVSSFRTLPHRLEDVGEYKGIRFYDDAISTTPESTICAIEALESVATIFLGGQDRGYTFDELVRIIDRSGIQNIVLFPDSGGRIEGLLGKYSKRQYNLLHTSDMGEAVQFAFDHTPKGTICLLSTASPSYSVWKNFEQKGKLFVEEIKKRGAQSA